MKWQYAMFQPEISILNLHVLLSGLALAWFFFYCCSAILFQSCFSFGLRFSSTVIIMYTLSQNNTTMQSRNTVNN